MTINRTPPHNIEAEAAILGAMLLDNKVIGECASLIGTNDFYHGAHGIIFRALCEIADSGKPVDSVILSSFLRERGEIEKIGGLVYVAELLDGAVSAVNVAHYAGIVKDKSILRQIIGAGAEMADHAYSGNGEGPADILDGAQRALMEISIDQKRNHLRGSKEVCTSTFKGIEARYEKKDLVTGLSTGFRDLDNWTSGLQGSELIIIAGRPGMGKTAFGLNIAENAVLSGVSVAVFSLEMSGEALMTRIFSSRTGIDSRRLRRGFISGDDWPRLIQVVDHVSRAPLFIDDSSTLTPMQLKTRARRLKLEKGLGLVVIDYLQLMVVPGKRESREREIAEISRSLKALAKELNIPVVALSQLNRAVESRGNRRPGLADLRESGAIEQDADVIMFLYRDEVYWPGEENPEQGLAEISIGKQRNGPTGMFKMKFDAERTRFSDLERQSDHTLPGETGP
jgi:replicative DNA helicase